MSKPIFLYYSILKYRPKSMECLRAVFDIREEPDPRSVSDELAAEVEALSAPLGFRYDATTLERFTNLKVIISNTTGEPHIDREYAEGRGITVHSLRFDQEFLNAITPVAEFTWGLIEALTRRIPWAYQSVLEGTWNRKLFGGKRMISRMSIGIIGLGRIGMLVARQARAFNMETYYYDIRSVEGPEGTHCCDNVEQLVASSDIVSLHIPHNSETEGFISQELLQKFKPGAYFINTARGEIVDHSALLELLQSGHLAGVAIDVFEDEFNPEFEQGLKNHPLIEYARSHDNLLITPHIGGSTEDAWELTERRVIDKAIGYFHG